jgi:hypothetical protein
MITPHHARGIQEHVVVHQRNVAQSGCCKQIRLALHDRSGSELRGARQEDVRNWMYARQNKWDLRCVVIRKMMGGGGGGGGNEGKLSTGEMPRAGLG